jgi:aspartyl protease family protein
MTTSGQPACANHPDAPATASCQACLKTVCTLCMVLDGSRVLCLVCARRARQRRTVTYAAIGVLVVGGAAAGLAFGPKHESATASGASDFAKSMIGNGPPASSSPLDAMEAQLAKEPCDRQQMLAFDEALMRAGQQRAVIDRTEAFWKKCGPMPRLRWITYEAHKGLSEFDKAIADASKLIDDNPQDKDFWWWRGIAYEETGQLDKAAADYQQSITIEPRITGIPFNLAGVYEKLGRPCDAIFPIEQFLRYHPDVVDKERVQERLARLYTDPACASMAGEGRAVIRFHPGDSMITTTVKMGRATGRFIVDTGASLTVISPELAAKLGLAPSKKITLRTASGAADAGLATVDSMEVQGVRAHRIPVAVLDSLPPGADGLLGLSFLARFSLQMETQAGRLTIAARGPGR